MAISRRRRVVTVLICSSLALVVLAGAAVWWVVLRDDTPPAAALVEREVVVSSAPLEDADLDGSWTVVPGPDVWAGYRITERVGGLDNVAVARTRDVQVAMTITGGELVAATATVDMATLKSEDTQLPGVGGRDEAMRGAGLQTDLHPTATFVLAEPLDLGALPEPGTEVRFDAVGVLTLHGVERQVTVPFVARWNGELIDLTASIDIALVDYAIDPPAPQIVTVADAGTIEMQLTLARVERTSSAAIEDAQLPV